MNLLVFKPPHLFEVEGKILGLPSVSENGVFTLVQFRRGIEDYNEEDEDEKSSTLFGCAGESEISHSFRSQCAETAAQGQDVAGLGGMVSVGKEDDESL